MKSNQVNAATNLNTLKMRVHPLIYFEMTEEEVAKLIKMLSSETNCDLKKVQKQKGNLI